MRLRLHPLVAALAALTILATPALAATDPVVKDCTSHNGLTQQYSAGQLRHALATMPADVKEYTACPDVIQRALDTRLGGLHLHGGSTSGGGSFLPTPVIVVLAVVLVGGAGFAAVAARRRAA